jgi:hypothetical protein
MRDFSAAGGLSAVVELRFTEQPHDPCWQLHPSTLQAAQFGLLGWICTRAPIDAGVPDEVVSIVSDVLVRRCRVSFLDAATPTAETTGTWNAVTSGTWACRLQSPRRQWLKPARRYDLTCSDHAQVVSQAFRSTTYAWERRCQVLLLSPRDSAPPPLTYRHIHGLSERTIVDVSELGMSTGVQGLLVPGVDGDFVEIILLDTHLWQLLLRDLEAESLSRGFRWTVVREDEFRNTSWYENSLN